MSAPTSVAAHMPATHGSATVNHQRLLTHCMNEEVRDWPALAKKCKHENGRAFPARDTQPETLKAFAALTALRVHVATKCQVNEKAADGGMPEGADDQLKRIIYARMAMVLQAAADGAGTNVPTAGVVWGTPTTTNVDAAAEAGSPNATTLAADTGKQPAAAASAAVTRKRTLADALAEAHQIASTEGVDLHDATAKFAKTSRTQATMDTEQSAGISAGPKAQTELLENARAINALIRESAGSENVEELRTKPSAAAQIDEQKEHRRKGKLNADGFVKVNGHDMGSAEPAEQQTKLTCQNNCNHKMHQIVTGAKSKKGALRTSGAPAGGGRKRRRGRQRFPRCHLSHVRRPHDRQRHPQAQRDKRGGMPAAQRNGDQLRAAARHGPGHAV